MRAFISWVRMYVSSTRNLRSICSTNQAITLRKVTDASNPIVHLACHNVTIRGRRNETVTCIILHHNKHWGIGDAGIIGNKTNLLLVGKGTVMSEILTPVDLLKTETMVGFANCLPLLHRMKSFKRYIILFHY